MTARRQHVAVVSQNADLALDMRPRAEAEALAEAGFDVTLVGGTRDARRVRELTAPAVELELFRLPAPAGSAAGQVVELGSSFLAVARALRRLARRRPIDILHGSSPPDNLWLVCPLVRLAQGFKPRFVFDQHDVAPVLLTEKYGRGSVMRLLATALRSLERASFKRASLTVFANADQRRRAEQSGLLRGPAVVVPYGWSLPDAQPNGRWRQDGERLIAYVGTINEQDCVDHLVEAVALLDAGGPARIVLAGDGSARRGAERRAQELGIADRCTWLGWVTAREEIASLVRSADVCVAPETASEFNELCSFVKLGEYMSAGAPVVAHVLPQTKLLCGDTIEYAEDMGAEALARAIERVLVDPDRAAELGSAALTRFESSLRWGSVGAPALVHAYRTVFGER